MKLMIASYNNGGSTWNAEAEETAFLHYSITHRFNEPAEATIIIADADGTKAQKYNVDANDVYIGPGKVTIEDPTGTDIFYGRIMRAEADTQNRTVTLYCQDWLSQLDEEQITYDMREDLDPDDNVGLQGLRESYIFPDYDDTDGNGIRPAKDTGAGSHVYDNRMLWDADQFNGLYFVLSNRMAGSITMHTNPYTYSTDGGIDTFSNDISDLWTKDSDKHTVGDVGGNWYVLYKFRVWTPVSGYFDSCTGARVHIISDGGTADEAIEVYNGATYDVIDNMRGQGSGTIEEVFEIPEPLLANMFDANGEAWIRFNDATDGAHNLYYIAVECDFTTIGSSGAVLISDTVNGNRLSVPTNYDTDATRLWHMCPYSIAKTIYKHIESASGPINGYDNMVALTCGAAQVENTSGVSTRQYVNKTPLEIAQDLARQDKAEFWLALGTTTVTYKSTWNDGAPTALTDTDVNSWHSTFDYTKMYNEFNIYGMRIGDHELYSNVTDATSIAKYKATRSQTQKGTGLVSQYDTEAYGTALVNQYKDVLQLLTCSIRGNTAYATHPKNIVLGDEISITSSYLGLTAAVYIIQRWEYDSRSNMTRLLLHPRVSQTGLQREEFGSVDQALQKNRRGDPDKVILAPANDIV